MLCFINLAKDVNARARCKRVVRLTERDADGVSSAIVGTDGKVGRMDKSDR